MAKKSRNAHMSNQGKMARALDNLSEYEEFQQKVAPRLRKAVAENWSVEKIYKEFGAYVAARMVTTALIEDDSGKSIQAAREVLDRGLGKPKERIESTHKYEKLSDDELDNLLKSTLQEVADDDSSDTLQ